MQSLKKQIVAAIFIACTLTTANAIAGNTADDGGYNKQSSSQNISNFDSLKKAKADLNKFGKELAEIFDLVKLSKVQQQEYLNVITNFASYLDAYIEERGECFTQEDISLISPSPFEENRIEQENDIAKCYAEADDSLLIYGNIQETVNKVYVEMLIIVDRAKIKGPRAAKIGKSMATLKASIDFLESQNNKG